MKELKLYINRGYARTLHGEITEGRLGVKFAEVFARITNCGWVDDQAVSQTFVLNLYGLVASDLGLTLEPLALVKKNRVMLFISINIL